MLYGEAGPYQFDEFRVFGGPAQRLHYRPPTTEEWERHELAYQNALGAYVSPVDPVKTDILGINRAHIQGALGLVTGIETAGDEVLPVEGDWREWLKGQGIYQPVLRRLGQWCFLRAAEAVDSRPASDEGTTGVAGDTPPRTGEA